MFMLGVSSALIGYKFGPKIARALPTGPELALYRSVTSSTIFLVDPPNRLSLTVYSLVQRSALSINIALSVVPSV